MRVKLTAKFFFDNGEVKRVDWYITDPYLTYEGASNPTKTPLTSAKEVQDEYMRIFRQLHKNDEVFAVTNLHNEASGVPFSKVSYWTIKAVEVIDEDNDGVVMLPENTVMGKD